MSVLLRRRSLLESSGATPPPNVGGPAGDLPIESDQNYTPAVPQGSVTDAIIESYFNAPIRQISYGQAGPTGHDYQSINSNGELVVTYPGGEWVQGTGTWFNIEPVQTMYAAADLFFPSGHDFALSGKLGLGLFGGSHPSGGVGLTNDDGGSVRLHWTVRNGQPEIDLYVYWANMNRQYGKTIFTTSVIPTNVWQRYIVGLNVGTPGNADGEVSLHTRSVGGATTQVVSDTSYVWQATGIPYDVDVFKFATFYGGSGAEYAPAGDQTVRFKHFKVGSTLDVVDDSPIVSP